MIVIDIAKDLRELEFKHRDVGDGGYALISDICRYRRLLDADQQQLLKCELIQLVEHEDVTLRGVALEVLVQEWGVNIAEQLAALLNLSFDDTEWEGYILFALVRLGYSPIGERAVKHVSQRLIKGDRTVFPLVAGMIRINEEQCLALATKAIVEEIGRGNRDKIEGYMPAFVRNFAQVNPAMLQMLVSSVGRINASSATILTNMLLSYLSRSYVKDDLGTSVVAHLRDSLISRP